MQAGHSLLVTSVLSLFHKPVLTYTAVLPFQRTSSIVFAWDLHQHAASPHSRQAISR